MSYIKLKVINIQGILIDKQSLSTNINQIGSGKNDINMNIFGKGISFWYTSKGKFITNGTIKDSLNFVLAKVRKNPKKYLNKELINISLTDWKSNSAAPHPIEIAVIVDKIVQKGDIWSYEPRNNFNSYIRFFVKESEFSHSYFKKLGKAVLDEKFKDGIEYTFEDIKKLL